ncbi:MAG TPA: hypothetical protein VEQ60_13050 [Longimicrobium sp.]|nr:hypothetical protein [Longimicrobium sp.]
MRSTTMPTRWAALVAAVAGLALGPSAGRAQQEVTSTFTKEAVAVRPGGATPVYGQVTVGQRIDYVLTAQAQGPGSVPATGIVDVLSPNQSYVPGSLVLPPGWAAHPNPPYPKPANQTTYTAPAGASMLSFQLPVGGGSASTNPSPGGDGMYPIPGATSGNVYAVFHHEDSFTNRARIDCWNAVSLVRCPGFPRNISASDDLATLFNFEAAVVQQRYIYYPAVQRVANTAYAGLGCWDTAVEQPCSFQRAGTGSGIVVDPSYPLASAQMAGVLGVPGTSRVLIAVENRLYCYDMAGGPGTGVTCGNWPAGGVVTAPGHIAASMTQFMDLAFEAGPVPSRVYVSVGGGSNYVQCVTLGTSGPAMVCPGWSSIHTAYDPGAPPAGHPQQGHDLHPIPGAGAVCLYTSDGRLMASLPANTGPACWNAVGNVVNLTALSAWPLCTIAACLAFTSMELGPGAGPNRVIFARWNNPPLCLEMTGTVPLLCTASGNAVWGSNLSTVVPAPNDYGFAPDPLAPNRCVLVLGHTGIIYRFDGKEGRLGCPVTYQTTGDPMDFFCRDKPTQLGWSQIVIRNRPIQLSGGTIIVRNTATGAVLQTIAVTGANSYSIASIPYATHHTLTVEFTPTYTGQGAAPPFALEVQFTANESPQICYQARVDACGPIHNTATFGPTSPAAPDSVRPSPWTRSAAVELGRALSDPCHPCDGTSGDSLDLGIRKQALFPPWTVGTLAEFEIRVDVQQGTLNPFTAPSPTFVDQIPAGLTFHSWSGTDWNCVPSGAQVACTYTGPPVPAGQALPPVTLTVNVVGPEGVVVNCAVLGPDANPENNRGCAEVDIRPCPTDLAIRKDVLRAPWTIGGTGVFQIRIGVMEGTYDPVLAAGPTFGDLLPAGVTFQSYAPQGPWTCTVNGQQVSCKYNGPPVAAPGVLPPVQITVNVVGPQGAVVNCAQLSVDQNPGNNRGCAEVALLRGDSTTADTVDLLIRKRAAHAPWTVGGTGAFHFDVGVVQGVFNPAAAPGPTFTDLLPTGVTFQSWTPQSSWNCTAAAQQVSCRYTGPAVPAGQALPSVQITVAVVGPPGDIANCAQLRPDGNPGNNRSCVELALRPGQPIEADLLIRKGAFQAPWTVGGTGRFQIRTTVMQGTFVPAASPGPTFTDVLPAGLTFLSYTPQTTWQCTASGQLVSCRYVGVPMSATVLLPPVDIIVGVVGPEGTLTNCAELLPDRNLANNRSCIQVVTRR